VINLTIPQRQIDFLDTLTMDAVKGRPKSGARTAIVSELLHQLEIAYLRGVDEATFEPALMLLHKHTEGKFLISYAHHARGFPVSFHYDVVDDVEAWVDRMEAFEDGPYILVNVLPISDAAAKRWDGALKSM
jgi:hypothetical protein